jgi:hypothetical protein
MTLRNWGWLALTPQMLSSSRVGTWTRSGAIWMLVGSLKSW